jgi:hypothetical protein
MTLTTVPFTQLLAEPELDWLDWKSNFPPGLIAGSADARWDEGRAKLLRAIVAIANTVYDRLGYVVYGVDDAAKPRTVRGISSSFDDAIFQDWNQATFRPRVDFQYREDTYDGRRVGVVEIRPSSAYPHVCERAVGGVLAEGQVWFRRGTRCTVAHHEDMRRMFEPQTPLEISEPDGAVVREIRDLWMPLGWSPYLPTIQQKNDQLAKGHRVAFLPGSRREIRLSNHVLLLRPDTR